MNELERRHGMFCMIMLCVIEMWYVRPNRKFMIGDSHMLIVPASNGRIEYCRLT